MLRVLTRDGTVIASVGPSYGQWLSYDEIPPVMIDAMIAVEDRPFYYHPGVDPIGITRAALVTFSRGGNYQGASPITQQIGRASCRVRVCPYVSISVVAVSFNQNKHTIHHHIPTQQHNYQT